MSEKKQRFLFQKPRKDSDPGFVYHWTPTLAKKPGMIEINASQAQRLEKEDWRVVVAPTDQATGAPEVPPGHILMAIPKALAPKVREMLAEEERIPEVEIKAKAVEEFADIPEPLDEAEAVEEGPNLRPLEVVEVEKARSKNEVEALAERHFPDASQRPKLDRRWDIEKMKSVLVEAMQAKILEAHEAKK